MKTKFFLAALAISALGFTACNSDDPSDNKTVFTDIVTLDTNIPNVSSSMSFCEIDDSPMIYLTSDQSFSTEYFKTGTRILMMYTTESNKHYVSGKVNILSAGNVLGNGYGIEPAKVDTLDNWKSDNVKVLSKWRAGNYLNIGLTIRTAMIPEKFELYYDVETLDNETVDCHIIFKPKEYMPGGVSSQDVTYFASYNIANFLSRPTCKALRINYEDSNGPTSFTIPTEGTGLTPAN